MIKISHLTLVLRNHNHRSGIQQVAPSGDW